MLDCETAIRAARNRNLEVRLVRRRAVEAAFRTGSGKNAHRDSLLLRDHIGAPVLRLALQITGLLNFLFSKALRTRANRRLSPMV